MTRDDILQVSATVWIWLIFDEISHLQGGRNEVKDVEGFKIRIDFILPR
jgi:hypothetical protein